MAIRFHFQSKATLGQRRAVKSFIEDIFFKEKKQVNKLDYIFCDDEYLLGINRKYLRHDFYTDVITFDLSETTANGIFGEVYISSDTVKSNSVRYQSTFFEELLRVMFHGALHLCGYQDKSGEEKLLMKKKEDHYLKMFHVKYG